jgi:sec-independent protein translocase protein TatA
MLSPPDLILIGAVALMVFGPKRLPEVGKGLGKGIREFKKAMELDDKTEGEDSRGNRIVAHIHQGSEEKVSDEHPQKKAQ